MPTMVTMQMSLVKSCNVSDCAYFKQGNQCHAMAITVGGPHPYCDTFFRSSGKGGAEQTGAVGACKVDNCKYNIKLECSAEGIDVGAHEDHADCKTFSPR
ncbi:MAG: DUF1540 domain-containing protein [Nitrospiraceae bacterium]|nr:DUF1540 domain-containing protein [Nitrospiraceae bacterium]MDA8324954.1 DUF1540 domain-containing protein [Nitrospiraceae bacterium]